MNTQYKKGNIPWNKGNKSNRDWKQYAKDYYKKHKEIILSKQKEKYHSTNDYVRLCASCHKRYDMALIKLSSI